VHSDAVLGAGADARHQFDGREVLPSEYVPRIHALLDEAPIALPERSVKQVHFDSNIAREEIWENMRKLAQQLKSRRDIWVEDC
jgi:hypothetical protein